MSKTTTSRVTATDERAEVFTPGAIDGVRMRDLRKLVDERGWLAELFRDDELPENFRPAMAYISATAPGMTRGPHEHKTQTDLFCFLGPSNFKLRIWDTRARSPTYQNVMTVFVGEDNPQWIMIPPRIVHAYRNIGTKSGIVFNCPDQLYAGEGKRAPVDEIRHEDRPDTPFKLK